ncbi:hypothetical protein WA026_011346, partial [Henosepilachna vigintioctopunctata]
RGEIFDLKRIQEFFNDAEQLLKTPTDISNAPQASEGIRTIVDTPDRPTFLVLFRRMNCFTVSKQSKFNNEKTNPKPLTTGNHEVSRERTEIAG